MEEFNHTSNYKSVWKPLLREDDLSLTDTVSDIDKSKTKADKNAGNIETPAEAKTTSKQKDVYDKITELCSDIELLHRMILEQGEKTDSLMNFLIEKDTGNKKNVFGLLRKQP